MYSLSNDVVISQDQAETYQLALSPGTFWLGGVVAALLGIELLCILDPAIWCIIVAVKARHAETSAGQGTCTQVALLTVMHCTRNCTSLSSKKVRHSGPSRDEFGWRIVPHREVLGPVAIVQKALQAKERQKAHLQGKLISYFKFHWCNHLL